MEFHAWTYWRSSKLLDSSNLGLLIDLKNGLAWTRARRESYCLGAASFLLLIMRKRWEDEKRSFFEKETRRNGEWESSYCTALCLLLCKLETSWTMPGFRAMPILAEFLPSPPLRKTRRCVSKRRCGSESYFYTRYFCLSVYCGVSRIGQKSLSIGLHRMFYGRTDSNLSVQTQLPSFKI